ncbi:MAG: hypothetical protein NXY57DRAFT_1037448 [Lentinula lateritia]|nr:MAG: hypothetical protein NXY57DRAFT_1037448 [Lentinula lateritia]
MDHEQHTHHIRSYPDRHTGHFPSDFIFNRSSTSGSYEGSTLPGHNQNQHSSSTTHLPPSLPQQTPLSTSNSPWSLSEISHGLVDMAASPPTPPSTHVVPVVDPTIVDSLAKDFGLPESQRKILQNYVQFGSAGGGLLKPDMLARLYDMAVSFSLFNQIPKDNEEDSKTMRGVFKDIRIRLQQTFSITPTQNKTIRLVAMDKVYDPLRSCYRGMNDDVFGYIKAHADEMMFSNIFGNPAYEQTLEKAIKKVSSSVRNAFRQHLRDSIANGISAVNFTHSMNKIYRRAGGPHFNEQVLLLRNIVLRRFIVDNPAAVWLEEDGNDASGVEATETRSPSPEMQAEGQEQPSRKRKKTLKSAAGGRVPKGQDFWSLIDAWFIQKRKHLGDKLTDPGWRALLDEYVLFDEGGFRAAAPSGSQMPLSTPSPSEESRSSPGSAALALIMN